MTERIREDFEVERTENSRLRIRAAEPGECRLYWSEYPDGFCDDNELGTFEREITVDDPTPHGRCYFHILRNGAYYVAAQKLWFVDGLDNLRDLGGYNTADGASFVRFGKFFRANRLCGLTEAGKRKFARLGIREIVDFRVPVEISGSEDPVFHDANYHNVAPISQDSRCFHMGFEDMLSADADTIYSMRDALREHYKEIPFDSEAYRCLFDLIKRDRTPLLFHCTAGKDRTGVAAALILLGLGVPRDTILYDYMLTCRARARDIAAVTAQVREKVNNQAVLDTLGMFMSVEQSSMEGTLDAIESRYGGDIPAYYEQELGVSNAELEAMKKRYLCRHHESEDD